MNLEHLRGNNEFNLITDTELVFLHGLISSKNPKTVVEIGGGREGFSTQIFLDAIKKRKDSCLFSIDILDMTKRSDNHITIQKSCSDVRIDDLNFQKIDILFLDAHVVIPQLDFYNYMVRKKLITDNTIIILHDTNLLYDPYISKNLIENEIPYTSKIGDGYVHQWVERNLVNYFKLQGYDVFNLITEKENHSFDYPYLFGISICQKFKPFTPIYVDYKE